jgi:hypothetical protein
MVSMLEAGGNEKVFGKSSKRPNTKHQRSSKSQIPSSSFDRIVAAPLELEIWDFSGAWTLGIWSFSDTVQAQNRP